MHKITFFWELKKKIVCLPYLKDLLQETHLFALGLNEIYVWFLLHTNKI